MDYYWETSTTTFTGNPEDFASFSASVASHVQGLNGGAVVNGTMAWISTGFQFDASTACCQSFHSVEPISVFWGGGGVKSGSGCLNTMIVGVNSIIPFGGSSGLYDGAGGMVQIADCTGSPAGIPTTLTAVFVTSMQQQGGGSMPTTSVDAVTSVKTSATPQQTSVMGMPTGVSTSKTEVPTSSSTSNGFSIIEEPLPPTQSSVVAPATETTEPSAVVVAPTKTSVVVGLSSQPMVIPITLSPPPPVSVPVSLKLTSTVIQTTDNQGQVVLSTRSFLTPVPAESSAPDHESIFFPPSLGPFSTHEPWTAPPLGTGSVTWIPLHTVSSSQPELSSQIIVTTNDQGQQISSTRIVPVPVTSSQPRFSSQVIVTTNDQGQQTFSTRIVPVPQTSSTPPSQPPFVSSFQPTSVDVTIITKLPGQATPTTIITALPVVAAPQTTVISSTDSDGHQVFSTSTFFISLVVPTVISIQPPEKTFETSFAPTLRPITVVTTLPGQDAPTTIITSVPIVAAPESTIITTTNEQGQIVTTTSSYFIASQVPTQLTLTFPVETSQHHDSAQTSFITVISSSKIYTTTNAEGHFTTSTHYFKSTRTLSSPTHSSRTMWYPTTSFTTMTGKDGKITTSTSVFENTVAEYTHGAPFVLTSNSYTFYPSFSATPTEAAKSKAGRTYQPSSAMIIVVLGIVGLLFM